MKRVIISLILLGLLVTSFSLSACSGDPETSETPTVTPTPAVTGTPVEYANWWDEFGEPQYGGQLNVLSGSVVLDPNFDPQASMAPIIPVYWFEELFGFDWTIDTDVWGFKTTYTPSEYLGGRLAESWEQVDPQTVNVYLRQGVHWQNKAPVNGREMTAEDVKYTYDRAMANPGLSAFLAMVDSVTVIDDYSLQFSFKSPNVWNAHNAILDSQYIVAPEWVEQGEFNNWENVIGTGAWILTDFVPQNSMTLSRNPDYWGYDERYPENQLPYADTLNIVSVTDPSTAVAAFRTGKIDYVSGGKAGALTTQASIALAENYPDILQDTIPSSGSSIDMRCDHAPFTDIRVRKAMQMALDLQTISEQYYLGFADEYPAGMIAPLYTDWTVPYEEWPQSLKDEFGYNPEGARALLNEAAAAGVFETNSLGGFDTNCVVNSIDDITLLEIVRSYLTDVGVDMEIVPMDAAAYLNYTKANKHDQMMLSSNTGLQFIPSMTLQLRYSKSIGMNSVFNNDAYYDQMYEQFNATSDADEAKQLSKDMDIYALEQHWSVQILPKKVPVAWQPYLKGYSGQYMTQDYYSRLWLDQALKESMGY